MTSFAKCAQIRGGKCTVKKKCSDSVAVATGYINRATTATAITTVLRSRYSNSLYRVLRSLHSSSLYRRISTPIPSHHQQRWRNTCARNVDRILIVVYHLQRYARTTCTDVSSPPSPKRAKKGRRHYTPPSTRYRRAHRPIRSTSLRRHSVNGLVRRRSRSLVRY